MVDNLLDWVEDAETAPKLAILLLLVVVTSLLAFQFVADPQRQRALAHEQTLRALDDRLAEMDAMVDPLDRLNNVVDVLAPQIEAQKKRLGLHRPIDHLLPAIVDTAEAAGVTLTSWQPEAPTLLPETDVHQVILRLDVEGRYHALAHFLDALRRLPKALIVRSLDYQVLRKDGEVGIHASFELAGFQSTASVRTEPRRVGQAQAEG